MTPEVKPAPDRFEQARERRTQQLIEAAIEVFSERGFERTTTREIAKRAGCAEGLIHFYFGGKRELLIASLEQARSRPDSSQELPLGDSFEESLLQVLLHRLGLARELRGFFRTCMSLAPIDPELAAMIETIEQRGVDALRDRFERLKVKKGALPADVDTQSLATLVNITAFHTGFFWQVVYERDRAEVESRVKRVVALLASSISVT